MTKLSAFLKLFLFIVLFLRLSPVLSQPKEPYVAIINVRSPIFMGTGMFIERVIQNEAKDAKAILVYLDTPGGDLFSTQRIIQAFLNSKVPIISYVHPSGATAASAGMFLLISGHIAAMAPGSTTGAATPVASTGQELSKDMRNKVVQLTSTIARALGEERKRNVDWVKKSVEEALAATAQEALDNNVIDIIAKDEIDLFNQLKGKEVKTIDGVVVLDDLSKYPTHTFEPNYKESILELVSNPLVAGVIFGIGALGVLLELYNPGAILPGALGVICLIISMVLMRTITIVVGAGLLIVAGLGMIIIDLFLGSIVLMVLGVISALAGILFYFDPSFEPIELTIQMAAAGPLIVTIALLLGIIIFGVIRGFEVSTPSGSDSLLGMTGFALGNFSTDGAVFVNGSIWKAKNVSNQLIKDKTPIKVLKVQGMTLLVEPAQEA
ncbi:MAG: ATP-dependent Clp protease proteolytic subunit [Deltaproteobacteria bacterium]|nr:ATP-dependent Clp protease proteolytic subunit [Deltaproteobacteria bacterium]